MNRNTDVSKYEILYDLPKGECGEKEIGGMRTKTIRAGDSLEVEAFPITHVNQAAKREAKKRKSSNAQVKLNRRKAARRLRRLAEHNYKAGDIVLHPTINYGFIDRGFVNIDSVLEEMHALGIPMDDETARKLIRNFIARIRRLIRRRGGNPAAFKYIYVIETTREPRDDDFNALPARYHYHMIITSLGILTAEDLQALWPLGYVKADLLDFRFNGLEGLCTYMTKQRRFTRRWAHSKNMIEPEEKVSNRKISRRRAAQIAADVRINAREIMEKIYPGYTVEEAEVKYSDFVAGAYIYVRMRRTQSRPRRTPARMIA